MEEKLLGLFLTVILVVLSMLCLLEQKASKQFEYMQNQINAIQEEQLTTDGILKSYIDNTISRDVGGI